MSSEKKRAPTLYAIIGLKLLKGVAFVSLGVVAYALSDNDLPAEFKHLLHWLRLNPEREFFSDLALKFGRLTEDNVLWVAAATLVYSLFSLVEGVGLIFRIGWAGWLAIGEAAFFIPVELYELSQSFSATVAVILALNVVIVWYLFQNRARLFHHPTISA